MAASALIVGCGRIAGGFNDADESAVLTHALAYRRLGVTLAGCCDRDPARAARLGRLGSPEKPCESERWAAINSACCRAALARASSHFRGGRPWAARSRLMAWKSCCSAASVRGWASTDVHENTTPTMKLAIRAEGKKVVSFMWIL